MRTTILTALCGLAWVLVGGVAAAQSADQGQTDNKMLSDGQVKIGLLTDMSGGYKAVAGPGSVIAVKMAIEDFGGSVLGQPIELVSANHQMKPSVGASIARQWANDAQVDMITGMVNSAVGLAVQDVGTRTKTITMNVGTGTTQLVRDQCSKYNVQYAYNTYALPTGTATAIVKNGGKTWFFITADYAFGHSMQANTSAIVKKLGGTVLGSVEHPVGTNDFASYIIQAASSGADVIALANAGSDFVNAVKQANEFGVVQRGQQLAAMIALLTGIKSLGMETAQGLQFTVPWYWNMDDESREWAQRFQKRHGAMPTWVQAGVYSATLTYLKAVAKAGTDDPDAVREALGAMTIDDMFVDHGDIQATGLNKHDMYLVQVNKPEESEGAWDLLQVVATIPADKAFLPLAENSCPRLEHNQS